jgi:hypothetical protein
MLHHARLRHDGQVMRWSNRRRGRQSPTGNWKINRSTTPTWDVWLHRWHSTVKAPRSAKGLPETERTSFRSIGALENSARFPAGSEIVPPVPLSGPWPLVSGTPKRARFPSGSGAFSPCEHVTSGTHHGVVDARG